MAMTTVLASTENLPELADALARRRQLGLDMYDDWCNGVYRVVPVPAPEHGMRLARLGAYLLPLADVAGLSISLPANIGLDEFDCRVADLAVYKPETALTSPAFLASAELVVEVLSPREEAGAKLDFYAQWGVREYLEIGDGARLLRCTEGEWSAVESSEVLGFDVSSLRLGEEVL
jgi:Uma2 family endonuclease